LLSIEHKGEVEAYVEAAGRKSDLERTELQKDKTGVFTGSYAINPATGKPIPIWVADYVLGNYGSGAIMAVPAHDTRDHAFAQKFGLDIVRVVAPAGSSSSSSTSSSGSSSSNGTSSSSSSSEDGGELPYCEPGVAVGCSSSAVDFDGLPTEEAKKKVCEWLESSAIGQKKVNYKLRDWLFARQRYWGEPFPLIYPEGSEEAEEAADAKEHLDATLSSCLCSLAEALMNKAQQQEGEEDEKAQAAAAAGGVVAADGGSGRRRWWWAPHLRGLWGPAGP